MLAVAPRTSWPIRSDRGESFEADPLRSEGVAGYLDDIGKQLHEFSFCRDPHRRASNYFVTITQLRHLSVPRACMPMKRCPERSKSTATKLAAISRSPRYGRTFSGGSAYLEHMAEDVDVAYDGDVSGIDSPAPSSSMAEVDLAADSHNPSDKSSDMSRREVATLDDDDHLVEEGDDIAAARCPAPTDKPFYRRPALLNESGEAHRRPLGIWRRESGRSIEEEVDLSREHRMCCSQRYKLPDAGHEQ